MGLSNDLHGVLPVLALPREGKLVFWLSVRDLVDAEPLVGCADEAGKVALDVLDVVELWGKRIVLVNDDDFPVGLLLIKKSHDTEDLHGLDLARGADKFSNLADIKRVVVALGLGLRVDVAGVFPGLLGGS